MKKLKSVAFWQTIFIFIWLYLLFPTDSYYSVYLLVGLIASFAIYSNTSASRPTLWLDRVFATLFSSFVTLANCLIYKGTPLIAQILTLSFILISGYIVFLNILKAFRNFSIKTTQKAPTDALKLSIICFAIMAIVYLVVLFLCCYPGTLTPDSVYQLEQILSNQYTNHHPFFATLIIKLFISIGLALFGNINSAIAVYSVFQILLLSTAFSYAIYTLRQIGISKKIIIPFFIFLMIMPYNIMYSFTLWKDVLFGITFLVFIISLFRIFKKLDRHTIVSLIILIISGMGICLFRSNSLIAFFVSAIIFFALFKKQHLKIGLILCGITLFSFILKSPLLKALDISQPDTVESLSIPMQQITLTLKENRSSFSDADLSLISNVADPNQLVEQYDPIIHDPIKEVVRQKGNQEYLKSHLFDFLKLYIKMGFRNPATYIEAWISQTRGYYNSGYKYWKWADKISLNDKGLEKSIKSPAFHSFLHAYLEAFENLNILNPFISIGLFVWVMLFILYRSIAYKNKLFIFISILLTTTWGTLLIATPVFSEFRYVYFLFTCVPFITIISFTKLGVTNEK